MNINFKLDNDDLLVQESLFSTANGYIGIRGNFEEGYKDGYDTIRGTYINGLYDIVDVTYGENAYGFPQSAQKMINIMDAQSIRLIIDGDEFSLFSGEITDYKRKLDLENGYAIRQVSWISPKGHKLSFNIKRMASFDTLELFIIDYEITSLNFHGDIKIISYLNGDVTNYTNANDPRVASGHNKLLEISGLYADEEIAMITATTKRSKLKVGAIIAHSEKMIYEKNISSISGTYETEIKKGQSFTFRKYVIYTDSIRHEDVESKGKEILKEVISKERDYFYKKQREYLNEFWKYAKIEIERDSETEYALNYSIYQLLASAGKVTKSNIGAKGLSGEGYEGHYFWDTEIYMIPFFTLTSPTVAENLMKYRYETLDEARKRAKEMGHKKGAKIPWRTIDGSECSAYYPAGSAQYHINADVAYSYIQYYLFSGKLDFIKDYGFEVIFETARIWLETGHFNDKGEFRIDAVTGPDEYTAIVNNNYYTNSMAKYHLYWTVRFSDMLEEAHINRWQELKALLSIEDEELLLMKKASEKIFLPYSEEMGVNLQDDSFINKKEWDFKNTPKENYPLLLHYHPLTIYRHKVLKQADTLLAHLLLDNERDEVIRNSYYYYERLTTHDSSLSPCVYSMMASRINNSEKAYKYFKKTLMLDLENLHGNTKDGLHIANAGGAYMTMIFGFGGIRIKEDGIHLRPTKPSNWKSYTFRLNYKNSLIKVTVSEKLIVESEKEINMFVNGKEYIIDGIVKLNYCR